MERICDNCIGTFSVDPMEDLLLVCSRRSEFIFSIREQYDLVNSKTGSKKVSTSRQSASTSKLPLIFASSFRIRPCGAPSLATRASDEVVFTETNARPKRKAAVPRGRGAGRAGKVAGPPPGGPLDSDFLEECGIASVDVSGGVVNPAVSGRVVLTITSFAGLPHELVSIALLCDHTVSYNFLFS